MIDWKGQFLFFRTSDSDTIITTREEQVSENTCSGPKIIGSDKEYEKKFSFKLFYTNKNRRCWDGGGKVPIYTHYFDPL